ncbi:MAG: GvpL/GvpF family gas vesicle protein [Acidobacteria bacterium]|nr:GvpL/GvpF family gas vesicle protein [Acidobacteriota bacterium]
MEQSATPQEEGRYVYGIIKAAENQSFGPIGIGGRNDEVYTVHYKDFAAVVSKCPLQIYDPTRENALAHEHVNEVVMKQYTVLPMSFGTVFRTEADIRTFMQGTYPALVDVLDKMEGKIEFGLKVNWDREAVLRQIEAENDDVGNLKQQIEAGTSGSAYFLKMQLGKIVESALQEKSEKYVQEIYSHLRDSAVASRSNKPIGDRMIMNAAFLVEREKTELFDQRVSEIAKKYEDALSFLYTGPWPPYNFVNIRLKLERADT